MASIHVKVRIGDKEVALEGPEDFVRAEVQRLTNSLVAALPSPAPPHSSTQGTEEGERMLPRTEREFLALKKPSGHSEIVAVLAYFLSKNGQGQFTPEDIKRAYARAGQRPPKVVAQALRDAKRKEYLETGSARGTFRLSAHGDRTVTFDLPGKET